MLYGDGASSDQKMLTVAKHKNNNTARLRSPNVIDLERTVIQNQNEIIDLKARSMKLKILIHNIPEDGHIYL